MIFQQIIDCMLPKFGFIDHCPNGLKRTDRKLAVGVQVHLNGILNLRVKQLKWCAFDVVRLSQLSLFRFIDKIIVDIAARVLNTKAGGNNYLVRLAVRRNLCVCQVKSAFAGKSTDFFPFIDTTAIRTRPRQQHIVRWTKVKIRKVLWNSRIPQFQARRAREKLAPQRPGGNITILYFYMAAA